MSLPIRGIYLKEVRTLLSVKMLILNLQSLSRSILANEVSLPAIIVVSLDTSGHTVLRSDINSLGSGNCGKYGHVKAECFKVKPHKPKKNQTNEGLVNMMKNVLVRLINWDMAHTTASQVDKV